MAGQKIDTGAAGCVSMEYRAFRKRQIQFEWIERRSALGGEITEKNKENSFWRGFLREGRPRKVLSGVSVSRQAFCGKMIF